MVLITIVTGAYKPTYNWGASHCIDLQFDVNIPWHFEPSAADVSGGSSIEGGR